MRVGQILPTFRGDAESVLERARRVADVGIDGVFVYDHLYPPGEPDRASLSPFPLLARLATTVEAVHLGPLVARVGHGSPAHLSESLQALVEWAPGRVIAGLGLGDAQGRREMEDFGLSVGDLATRRRDLAEIARSVAAPVWIGGRSPALVEIADSLGAALNLWNAPLDEVERFVGPREVTWAGMAPEGVEGWLDALAERGVTWCVFTSHASPERLGAWCATR